MFGTADLARGRGCGHGHAGQVPHGHRGASEALNRVDFPVLGLPINAIFTAAKVAGSTRCAIPDRSFERGERCHLALSHFWGRRAFAARHLPNLEVQDAVGPGRTSTLPRKVPTSRCALGHGQFVEFVYTLR